MRPSSTRVLIDEHLDAVLEAEEAVEQDERAADPADQAEDPTLEADADPEARREIDDPRGASRGRPRRRSPGPTRPRQGRGHPRRAALLRARRRWPTTDVVLRRARLRAHDRGDGEAGCRSACRPRSGALQQISSAGMLVSKAGRHGEGRACDWDRLTFANAEISPIERDHASPSIAKRRHYWAFAAICRSNSSFVLHGLYNAEHADHIHCRQHDRSRVRVQ